MLEFGQTVKGMLLVSAKQIEKQQTKSTSNKRSSPASAALSFTQFILSELNLSFYKDDLAYLGDLFDIDLTLPVPPLSFAHGPTREKFLTSFADKLYIKLAASPYPMSDTLSTLFQ